MASLGNIWQAAQGSGLECSGKDAIVQMNPCCCSRAQVGYCQSMNYLAAMLLLALGREEESAFWVLVCLIDDGGALVCCIAMVSILQERLKGKWI